MHHSATIGALLGTAVGDALGLPYEGMSRRRGLRVFGEPDRYHFLLGHGMVSDDTEHTCMVAQALLTGGNDVEAFARSLAWRLRWWFLGLPAGIGRATLRSCLKLWLGCPPRSSGVFSAGNGPAMRSAILGASLDEESALRSFVRASTRLTHTDPKAEYGALAVALAAQMARQGEPVEKDRYLQELTRLLPADATELLRLVESAVRSVAAGETTTTFAESQGWGRGITGYVYHTVPIALHAWLRNPRDFRGGVLDAIRCGGDTDTTAAIVGGIIGAGVGKPGIPAEWLERLWEWPRTVAWMERLGQQLDEMLRDGKRQLVPRLSALGLLLRNVVFLLVVLGHVVRRCLPPY